MRLGLKFHHFLCPRMFKRQLAGKQPYIPEIPGITSAVAPVAGHRSFSGSHLDANLMMAPGFQMDTDKSVSLVIPGSNLVRETGQLPFQSSWRHHL